MVRKLKLVQFDLESQAELELIRQKIGQVVPLSHYYLKGHKPTLVSIDGEFCMLRYPNGVTMRDVPVKDLVDDAGYWKS